MTRARREALKSRILEAIQQDDNSRRSEPVFPALALDLFAYQFDTNPLFRRFCESRGKTPDSVADWRQVPAIPTDAFKAAPLLSGDPADAIATFRTSGTTQGGEMRGEHHFLDLSLYRSALRKSFTEHLLPTGEGRWMISLVPSSEYAPDSSLSFMVSDIVAEYATRGEGVVGPHGVDVRAFLKIACRAIEFGEPVIVLGTSFSFVHLLDALERERVHIELPDGSAVMDTGGFKGKSREVPREELYREIQMQLGVPVDRIINEYGMTEMSSQFYDGVVGKAAAVRQRRYRSGGWVRTVAADPETLEVLPDGERGILRHIDLANLDSAMALQTADVGIVHPDGFELFGRAVGAESRGCSIAMDELLQGAESLS